MSEITIKIDAPELAQAILALAAALSQSAPTMQPNVTLSPVQQQASVQPPQATLQTVPQAVPAGAPPIYGQQNPYQFGTSYQYDTSYQQGTQQAPTQPPAQQTPPIQQPPVQPPAQDAPAANGVPVGALPTSVPTYAPDQLALAASQLVDAGRINEIRGLLAQFGVQALTALPVEQYGAFATALRQLGAKL